MIYQTEIFTIVVIFFTAYISACASWFWDFCIGEPHHGEVEKGRIFSRFGSYILEKYYEHESKEKDRLYYITSSQEFIRNQKLNLYKILGVCPICMNVYVAGIIGLGSCFFFGVSFWSILPEIFVSYRFLRKFLEI